MTTSAGGLMSLRETVTGVGSCPAAAAEIVFQTGAVQMIEYLRFASLRAVVSRGVSSDAREILSPQAAGNYTLIEIKLTERSDIHNSSIVNRQSPLVRIGFCKAENGSCLDEAEVQAGLHWPIALSL